MEPKQSKFDSYKDIFITSTNEITSTDLVKYMAPKMPSFAHGTKFYLIAGFHGAKNGNLGKPDGTLIQNFEQNFFNSMLNVCGIKGCDECLKPNIAQHGPSLWNDKDFDEELITVYTTEESYKRFVIDPLTTNKLKRFAKKMIENKKPFVLIFASCFSNKSKLNDFLREIGILATLTLIKERDDLAKSISGFEGSAFFLDPCQQAAINRFREVNMTWL